MLKIILYCCKAKPLMEKSDDTCYEIGMSSRYIIGNDRLEIVKPLNGKIVAECEVETEKIFRNEDCVCLTKSLSGQAFEHFSCLNEEQLNKYFGFVSELTKVGYALHISNLKIFDKPLELKDTYTRECIWNKCSRCEYGKDGKIKCCTIDIPLSRAPQNMMWVWYKGERYVLISIQSKWLCKILNGEKTIEVRRKVLKGMVE